MSYSRLRTLYLAVFVVFPTLIFGQNAAESPNVVGTAIFTSGPCGAHLAGAGTCKSGDSLAVKINMIFKNIKTERQVTAQTDDNGFLTAHLDEGHYILSIAENPLAFSMVEQELDIQDGKILQLMLRIDLKRP